MFCLSLACFTALGCPEMLNFAKLVTILRYTPVLSLCNPPVFTLRCALDNAMRSTYIDNSTGMYPICARLLITGHPQQKFVSKSHFIYFSRHLSDPKRQSGQSSRLLTQRSRVRFPALPYFLRNSRSGTGSTQPHDDN
jgi:hypothetical protein